MLRLQANYARALLLALVGTLAVDRTSAAREGDSCRYGNSNGVCRGYSHCRQILEVSKVINICGYSKTQAIVCCPSDYEQQLQQIYDPNLRISERKCREYTRKAGQGILLGNLAAQASLQYTKKKTCSTDSYLILGGTEAKTGEFPHMAIVGTDVGGAQPQFHCGGTLISEWWVMTAAHCLVEGTLVVRLGELHLDSDDDAIDFAVTNTIKHPKYKVRQVYHDIALMQLARMVIISSRIRPACLNTDEEINRSRATAIGFGAVEAYGTGSRNLLKVSLDLFSSDACSTFFQRNRRVPNGITSQQLCAGYLDGGRDTCGGDSGGPLQISNRDDPCIATVVGITSFGISCGTSTPGIYTRVSAYLDWIESIVWPQS